MQELISVVVPVYGAESYLEKCVRSIMNQTYRNLEIILVNDNSPDNSGQLCDKLAREDERIIVIHREENGGISAARNTGIDIASSGISGTSIYAAKGGTVIKAGYNRGYGNYVVIDHGGGYATLYGHASVLNVSAGQTVTKGDVIAKVGSSGYSTGPHLHFEIIKNGEYTNPISYFSGVMQFTYY